MDSQREIKFRAWDGNKYWNNVAVYNGEPYVWNYEETSLVPLFSEAQKLIYGVPILEQYIGLKDKNGVKIFEGDIVPLIVEYIDNTIENDEVEEVSIMPSGDIVVKIKSDGEALWFNPKGEHLKSRLVIKEIIGNIHEGNKELLEQK